MNVSHERIQVMFYKSNGRLIIADLSGRVLYTPPDFLRGRIRSRDAVADLARRINAGERYIDVITEFEGRYPPLARRS